MRRFDAMVKIDGYMIRNSKLKVIRSEDKYKCCMCVLRGNDCSKMVRDGVIEKCDGCYYTINYEVSK